MPLFPDADAPSLMIGRGFWKDCTRGLTNAARWQSGKTQRGCFKWESLTCFPGEHLKRKIKSSKPLELNWDCELGNTRHQMREKVLPTSESHIAQFIPSILEQITFILALTGAYFKVVSIILYHTYLLISIFHFLNYKLSKGWVCTSNT